MQLSGTHGGFHHQTKWNIPSLIYQNTNFEHVRKISISGGTLAPPLWPLPSHFHCHTARQGHSSGPGQRTPPARSQMHGAGNKINLVAIVFPPVWWPHVSSSVTAGRNKKVKLGCTKNYESGWGDVGGGLPEWSQIMESKLNQSVYEKSCKHGCFFIRVNKEHGSY